ncbi:MAG: pyrroloquinoline quinone biosynthesis protein PqqB [Gemmatimonadales bacterium]|nr:pyrroloquinoline quinone biosynthesis protein PqqB [Gemmatimonadales bacterium]
MHQQQQPRGRWRIGLTLTALVPSALGVGLVRPGPSAPVLEAAPYVVVLGIAQDGGVPQAGAKPQSGSSSDELERHVVSLGVIDPETTERWLIEATPDFPAQLRALDRIAAAPGTPGLRGIFLTHAHMGHYTGLMHLGHEAIGARQVPVYAMPQMAEYLRTNGPWSQLVRLENIVIHPLRDGTSVRLNRRLSVTPLLVPHRQEFSEVVGFRIEGPAKAVLFVPDIDRWDQWDRHGRSLEAELARVDVAYLDGTFFADREVGGRDMSAFPHPFITTTMERLRSLPAEERAKVRFIHLNHSNPALRPGSDARRAIEAAGFRVAEELERVYLGE